MIAVIVRLVGAVGGVVSGVTLNEGWESRAERAEDRILRDLQLGHWPYCRHLDGEIVRDREALTGGETR